MSTDWTTYDSAVGTAFVAKQTAMLTQMNVDIPAIEADVLALQTGSSFTGTSVTSETIGTGSKTFTIVETNRSWGIGSELRITDDANVANYMIGNVTSYSGTTLIITINVTGGSGTKTAWTITSAVDDQTKADKSIPATTNNLAGLDANGNLQDSGITPGEAASQSNLAKSGLLSGTLSLDDTVLTNVQVNKTYTGNGSTQSITTNIASEDINWVTGTAYVIGDIRFTRDGTGVTAGAFTLWQCNSDHTA